MKSNETRNGAALATDRPRVHAGLGMLNLVALIGGLVAATVLGQGTD